MSLKNITLNKDVFINKFLLPISRVADNARITLKEGTLSAICNSQDSTTILFTTLSMEESSCEFSTINLPDVKKFTRLLDCIDENNIVLKIENNRLSYNTKTINFNYYLLEDSFMQKCPVNPDKINTLNFDTTFTLTTNKLADVFKGSSIATDSDKLYFYTKNDNVYAELNDFERQNINNITYLVSDEFTGTPIKNALPLNFESIRLLSGLKTDNYKVSVNNDLKITLFESTDKFSTIKFIISGLVK